METNTQQPLLFLFHKRSWLHCLMKIIFKQDMSHLWILSLEKNLNYCKHLCIAFISVVKIMCKKNQLMVTRSFCFFLVFAFCLHNLDKSVLKPIKIYFSSEIKWRFVWLSKYVDKVTGAKLMTATVYVFLGPRLQSFCLPLTFLTYMYFYL